MTGCPVGWRFVATIIVMAYIVMAQWMAICCGDSDRLVYLGFVLYRGAMGAATGGHDRPNRHQSNHNGIGHLSN